MMYRLDRTAFSMHQAKEKVGYRKYWLSKTPAERLAASWYLTCAAWNLDWDKEHRLDRTAFSIRQRPANAAKYL